MSSYITIGTSSFHDTTVGSGPFRSFDRALKVSEELSRKGWNTEIVELLSVDEIGQVINCESRLY